MKSPSNVTFWEDWLKRINFEGFFMYVGISLHLYRKEIISHNGGKEATS